MFWSFNLTLPDGTIVTYWNLIVVSLAVGTQTGICTVNGYLDQTSFNNGLNYVIQKQYTVNFASIDPNHTIANAVGVLVQANQVTIESALKG